jgi:hydrogenase nickel incorporation protein HypB
MTERVSIGEAILGANEKLAADNRRRLDEAGVFSLNLMASPGAGKTSLIERTLQVLASRMRIAVIDGDIATSLDADRAAAAGAQAIQVNTGGECHLDAVMIRPALERLDLSRLDLLMVENVGNLVCPAGFALGTHKNVLIASVPEGADKPHKYPGMYRGIQALVLNKVDLLPYVDFDRKFFQLGVEALNPGVVTFPVSCRTAEGLDAWLEWIEAEVLAFRREHTGRSAWM